MKSAKKTEMTDVENSTPVAPVKPSSNDLIYRKDKIESVTGVPTEGLNSQELLIASNVAKYMEEMKSNVLVTEEAGANKQLELFHTLNMLFNHDTSRFKEMYKWTLKAVSKNRQENGAFNDKYVMRFHSWMNLSVYELKTYRSLLSLLIVTSDLKLKGEVTKRVDVQAIIDDLKNKAAKDNLLNFYFN